MSRRIPTLALTSLFAAVTCGTGLPAGTTNVVDPQPDFNSQIAITLVNTSRTTYRVRAMPGTQKGTFLLQNVNVAFKNALPLETAYQSVWPVGDQPTISYTLWWSPPKSGLPFNKKMVKGSAAEFQLMDPNTGQEATFRISYPPKVEVEPSDGRWHAKADHYFEIHQADDPKWTKVPGENYTGVKILADTLLVH